MKVGDLISFKPIGQIRVSLCGNILRLTVDCGLSGVMVCLVL